MALRAAKKAVEPSKRAQDWVSDGAVKAPRSVSMAKQLEYFTKRAKYVHEQQGFLKHLELRYQAWYDETYAEAIS